MNARTLIISAGAIAALAAPAVGNARIIPADKPAKHAVKHAVKTHAAKQLAQRQGQSRQIYLYWPGPVGPAIVQSQQDYEAQYNQDLVEHGLDPVTFPDSAPTPAAADVTETVAVDAPLAVAEAPTSSSSSGGSTTDDSEDC